MLYEISVCQLITTTLIEHYEKLLSLGVLGLGPGEALVTDCIGHKVRDAVPAYLEGEVLWSENVVHRYEQIRNIM